VRAFTGGKITALDDGLSSMPFKERRFPPNRFESSE
jgi:hypothetical protein